MSAHLIKVLALIAVCVAVQATTEKHLSAKTADNLPESDVTTEKIASVFSSAFIKNSIDSDGDLRLESDGLKIFIRMDKKKKLLHFLAIFPLKKSVSELEKLRYVNRLNDKLILVRFCMPKPTVLWCDYQLTYENGIPPFLIVQTYRTFQKVVRGAVTSQDPDDIVGSDK